MKTFKELLTRFNACEEGKAWVGDKTIEDFVKECYRGDWMLWLAVNVNVPMQVLTLAKGKCAETVEHLMTDERSIEAVKVAIRFGEGTATIEELNAAAYVAYAVYAAANAAYADNAADHAAAYAAYAVYAAANAAAYADNAADNAAYAAYAADNAAYADKKNNQMLTADICRKYLGDIIIENVNNLLKK